MKKLNFLWIAPLIILAVIACIILLPFFLVGATFAAFRIACAAGYWLVTDLTTSKGQIRRAAKAAGTAKR